MPSSSKAHQTTRIATRAAAAPRRWLLFVHQLPSEPSNLRVRTWRRLQQLGAIPVKQAVYVLPDTPHAREDFEWLKTEIEDAGGQASLFAGDSVDNWSDDTLVEEFRRSRQAAYGALADDVERVLARIGTRRRRSGSRAPAASRLLGVFRQRLTAIESIDYFGSAGRDRVVTLLAELESRVVTRQRRPAPTADAGLDLRRFRNRLWVTRPRPGVDRMASAWLIGRFIDPEARFGFVDDRAAAPPDAVPFDMFGVEFTHRGDHCTFETLCAVFGLASPALERVAAVVHDLDLKDGRFGAPEAATVGLVIDGLRLAHPDDAALLAHGIALFDALYRAIEQADRPGGPRAVAGTRRRGRRARPAPGGSS
jgi:hypothetical protein